MTSVLHQSVLGWDFCGTSFLLFKIEYSDWDGNLIQSTARIRSVMGQAGIAVFLFALCLTSCSQIGQMFDDLPTATLTPTPINCPDVDSGFVDVSTLDLRPKVVVILLESTPGQHEVIRQAVNLISELIPALVEPGDQIVVFNMGFRDYLDAVVVDIEPPRVVRPAIPPSPTPPATLLSGVAITPTSVTQLGQTRERNEATATAQAMAATATLEWAYYNCAQEDWATLFSDSAEAWEEVKESAVAAVVDELQATLGPIIIATPTPQEDQAPKPTPLANSVYEGLAHASSVYRGVGCNEELTEDSPFSRCLLIIFDNLHDWRRAEVENGSLVPQNVWSIDLENVEVLSIMLNCLRVYEPSCVAWQGFWTEQFGDAFGAVSVKYLDGRNIEQNLAEFFSR